MTEDSDRSVRRARGPVLPSDEHALRRLGEARTDGGAAYLWSAVAEELIYAALYRAERLQIALLLGDVRRGPGGPFVEIKGYTELATYPDHDTYIEELNADWQLTHNRIQRTYPGLRIVGWVSMRAGSQGVISAEEQIVHRTFFNLPHQVAVQPPTEANAEES